MQNRSAIRIFTILLVLASLYSLSFNYFTSSIESEAREIATSEAELDPFLQSLDGEEKSHYLDSLKNKIESDYLDSMKAEEVYPVFGYTYGECKEKELNFGLDLKGGMNVTLEISVVDLLKAIANNSNDTLLIGAIKKAEQKQTDSQEEFVSLFCNAFNELYPNEKLATVFYSSANKDYIRYDSPNEDVQKFLEDQANSAIDNSFNVLRTRIDKFGVVQPNIQDLGGGKILVELPGVKDKSRVRKLLQSTAKLEFWETYKASEVSNFLQQINEKVRELEELKLSSIAKSEDKTSATATEEVTAEAPEKDSSSVASTEEKDTAGMSELEKLALKEENDTTKSASEIAESKSRGPLFDILQLNIFQNASGQLEFASSPVVGYVHKNDTAEVNKYLSLEQSKRILPRNIKFLWSVKPQSTKVNGQKESTDIFMLYAIKIPRDGKAPLDGDVVTDARVDYGQNAVSAGVSMKMDVEGASTWARLTRENINNHIAIVLDNNVYSAPVVRDEIKGGNSIISGDFSQQEARDLENVLKSGKLPAPARIIEEVVVGPSLGQESVNAGLTSFIIALVIVLLYMLFYYQKAGYVANLALLLNMLLVIGVLSSLQAVLTLSGIAGIVLTIGMSVDANVLIFERVREEISLGKGIKMAVADGYKNAYSAIIDANVTTLLTGIILATFGTGPIKGFATTLIIGIITSLFCAIFITRLIFERMLEKKSDITFDTKLTRNAFKNLDIKFIEKKKLYYAISGLIIAGGIISMATRSWDFGIDFKGGRNYDITLQSDSNSDDIKSALAVTFGAEPQVKTHNNSNRKFKITTDFMINDKSATADSVVESALFTGMKPIIGNDVTPEQFNGEFIQSSQKVGPTIADDIISGSLMAVFFSLLLIFLYIFIRFRNWKYGLGAVAALFHDVLIVLGIFSMLWGIVPFSLEIDQAFIAAILTVIGYSINDTVVVFDRVREYNTERKMFDMLPLFNKALNSTMSRTFSTSLSTFVVLLTIFILGGDTIRGFVFAMMIGVVVGTYSSLFIASPVVYDTSKKSDFAKK